MLVTIELLNPSYAPWGLIEKYETGEGVKERPKLWLTELCMTGQLESSRITPEDLIALKKGETLGVIKTSGIELPQNIVSIVQPGIRVQDVVLETKEDIEYSNSKQGEDIYYPFIKPLIEMGVKDFKIEFKNMMKTKPPLAFLRALRKAEEDEKNRTTILDILDKVIEKVTYSLTQAGRDNKDTGMNDIDNAYYDLIKIDLSSPEETE